VLGCRGPVDRPAATVAATAPNGAPAAAASPRAVRLPLRFEENRGQFDAGARFVARQGGVALYLGPDGSVMTLRKPAPAPTEHSPRARALPPPPPAAPAAVLSMRVHGARPDAALVAGRPLLTRSNYFIGNDPSRWRTGVPNFGEVRYRGVRPGVDLVYHGSDAGRLEYDFVVAPGASPDVALDVEGARKLRVAADGWLEIDLGVGELLRQPPPTVYQEVDGKRRVVAGRYRVVGKARVGFTVAAYDRARTLVIDPVLSYASYLGGSGDDQIYGVVVDAAGAAYVSGYTGSANFPVSHPLYGSHSDIDGFVGKLTPAGDALVWATYLGGGGTDAPWGRTVDASGAVYVAGMTASADFPLVHPIYSTLKGTYDAFVAKLSPAGDALVYSTYLSGSDTDVARAVAVDASGAAYVGGYTYSDDYPVLNAYQATKPRPTNIAENGFITKLTPAGDALVYSTFFGGSGGEDLWFIDVDAAGAAYVGGFTYSSNLPTANGAQKKPGGDWDAFVAKLMPSGSELAYATYVGGSRADFTWGFTIDADGAAYISGNTSSTDFPVVHPLQDHLNGPNDCFLTKVTPAGDAFAFSTYFGGGGYEEGDAIVADASGVYLAGASDSLDFPVANGVAPKMGNGFDVYVAKLVPAGDALVYSTTVGGSGNDQAWGMGVDGTGSVIVAGETQSKDFPVLHPVQAAYGGGLYDGLILKLSPDAAAPLSVKPTSATVPPRGPQAFVPFGGSGGYQWSVSTNASGATIDHLGRYKAGATPNVTDVVTLSDSAGASVTATVQVGPALSVSPAAPSVAPLGTVAFTTAGGSGTGNAWAISVNHSGGTIDAASGAYKAGGTPNVSDTVTVTDSVGNSATAIVSVGRGVSISPATPATPPLGSITFSASGGSGIGYAWSLASSGSGATITGATGVYKAGAIGNSSDTVRVVDSLGNSAMVNVSVGGGLVINPPSPSTAPKGVVQLNATGGSGTGYGWALTSNQSGATIDAATGKYTAGATGNVSDTVQLHDSLGNTASVTIAVGPGLQIVPAHPSTTPLGTVALSTSGGSGAGYTWSIATNNSGGTVSNYGIYRAGITGSVNDTVRVTDSLGNTADVDIAVGAGVSIMPGTAELPPRGTLTFSAAGGSGNSFHWTLLASPSGGNIDSQSGAYHAGPIGSVIDRVRVVDELGNKASLDIAVGPGVAISPAKPTVQVGGFIDFMPSGGSHAGYSWSVVTRFGTVAGHIDAATGHYTAGAMSGTDTVQLLDSLGNSAQAPITVTPGPPDDTGSGNGGNGTNMLPPHNGCGCQLGAAPRPAPAGAILLMLALFALAAARRRLG
jgi:MYXO-CTERM domain-containing protein